MFINIGIAVQTFSCFSIFYLMFNNTNNLRKCLNIINTAALTGRRKRKKNYKQYTETNITFRFPNSLYSAKEPLSPLDQTLNSFTQLLEESVLCRPWLAIPAIVLTCPRSICKYWFESVVPEHQAPPPLDVDTLCNRPYLEAYASLSVEEAVIRSSGMKPYCIPRGFSQAVVRNKADVKST